jgi:SAM-dependent methyltransferase
MTIEEIYQYPDDYDLEVSARDLDDLPFWRAVFAREQPQSVLEIGCGTGRLTVPFARMGAEQGFRVVGLDIEPEMLAYARRRADTEPAVVREVLRFEEGDVRALGAARIAERFDVVCLPCGMAHHLTCLDEQLAAWRGIHGLLKPYGLLAVDLCAPDLSLLVRAKAWTERCIDLCVDGGNGRHLRRSVATRYFPETQLVIQEFEYDVAGANGTSRHYRSPFNMHVYFPQEVKLLLQLSGYRLERLCGSYNGEVFGNDSRLMIALARPDGSL